MKPTVVTFTTWDQKTKSDITRMIIIATDSGVVASGDPETMAASTADDITASFRGMADEDLKTAVPDMLAAYQAKKTSGYGMEVSVADYTGAAKASADKIVADWTAKRAEKVTKS